MVQLVEVGNSRIAVVVDTVLSLESWGMADWNASAVLTAVVEVEADSLDADALSGLNRRTTW